MAFFCHQCGSALAPGARFCSNCGTATTTVTSRFTPGTPLIRPRRGRWIAGVCLAFSRSYGWDISMVRIVIALALLFSSGLFGIAYLAAWIGIPEEPLEASSTLPPAA